MADDRGKRPRYAMSDLERVQGTRRIPRHVDPEETPPPMEPARLPIADSIPPEIAEQFDLMGQAIDGLTKAVGRVWDARDIGPEVQALKADVAGFSRDVVEAQTKLREFVDPAIKGLMAHLTELASTQQRGLERLEERLSNSIEKLDKRLDEIGGRLNRLENSVSAINGMVGGVSERVAAIESASRSHDARLDALERRMTVEDAGDAREQALVVRRNRYVAAAWSAVTAIGGAIAGYLAGGCA